MFVFCSFWGAFLEHFWRPNRFKKRLMLEMCVCVCGPGLGAFWGFRSALFSHRFLHRFLVAFGSDFGAMLGGIWEPKSVIFGIDFLMIFGCRPKSGQERPKSAPRAPKSGPRAAKSGLRAAKRASRRAKSDPRGPQEIRNESEKITRAVQAK